jgi:tRNA threonylcarbamoyladenosine modification (KEOPS) complex  Pcc1 subunit
MKAKATIRLKFSSSKHLETVKVSLLPEVNKHGFGRAHVTLNSNDAFLMLTVEADDTVALRSTLNAYLRWISSTINVVETLDCVS